MRSGSCLTTGSHSVVLFSGLLFFLSGSLFSQSILNGSVTGRQGEALPYATVSIRETNVMAISDSAGHFSILASPGNLLEVTYVGYLDYQVVLGTETELHIVLTQNITNLDELIIVGYGTSKRKDITGAVTRVMPVEFNTGIITNPLHQLQGKVAGLVVVQPGGDPNGEFTVRIRGASSLEGQPPLLVIDGVAIDDFNRAVSTLNPNDIESYDILKDASAAAIYGSRGANGVILVTTKKGNSGKTIIEYNGYLGMETISNYINVLNADQWRKATTGMNTTGFDKGVNTDWQKVIGQTGFSNHHTIGASGGGDQINFRGSVGYIRQEGVILNSGKEVITARLTAKQKALKDKLEINYGINTSTIHRDFLPDQFSTSQSRTGGAFVFGQSLNYLPVWPEKNPDGTYYQPPNNIINPAFILKERYGKQRENFFQGSVKTDYELVTGLKLGVFGALSRGNDIYDRFWPAIPGTGGTGEATKSSNNKQIFSGDFHGNYRRYIGKHTFDLTGVYEYNKFVNDGYGVIARGFLVPKLLNNNLGTATNIQPSDISSYKNEVKLISLVGRAVYSFDDRYIFTATIRRDGSSKFGVNNRWGNFPSLALAWRVSNENFLNEIKWLNNLKVRFSYGFTGNQESLPPNRFQQLYGPAGPYLFMGMIFQSYTAIQENNPDLKWEVRRSFNIGVDFSILRDRINGTIDVFNDKTNDMLFLYDLPQPPFITNRVYANAASAINKGVELTLGATVVKNKRLTWETQANIGTLKNQITKLLGQFKGADLSLTNRHYGYAYGGGFGGIYVSQLEIGYPAGVFWIPQHAGLDNAGHELYNNYDSERKFSGISTSFTDQDRVLIDPTPDFTWGFTNNFKYGNFSLSLFLRGVQGQKIFANSLLQLGVTKYLPGRNIIEDALTNGFSDLPQPSTYWLRDGSYTRLENISLGYNFINLRGITRLKVYLTATNLFVITNYDGVDPEIRTEGAQRYIDANYYPKTRGFTIGANLEF